MQSSDKSCREDAKLRPHSQLSSPGLRAIAHMDRATQYAAAYRFKHDSLWNTGSPGQAGRRHRGWPFDD